MNKYKLLVLFVFSALSLTAQNEIFDPEAYCSGYAIMEYLGERNIYEDIFRDPDRPNADKAIAAAWEAFNGAFSLENLPHGLISEIFEPAALENVNSMMSKVGNSLALIQIASDYAKGERLSAVSNSTKTSMFYAIGKWGWKSLKIAGAGLQVFDYMLTSFGQYAVGARQAALAEAYNKYYLSGRGKRNLTEWKAVIEKLDDEKAIREAIDGYLNLYFEADALDKEISGGWYTDKEVADVKKEFLHVYLLPYLEPLFNKLEEDAREEQIRYICGQYRKLIGEFNSKKYYRFYVKAAPEQLTACTVGVEIITDEGQKLFVKGPVSEDGFGELSFTQYSLIVNNAEDLRAVLRYYSPRGPEMFYEDLDLRKNHTDIRFTLPEEAEESEEEKPDAETQVSETHHNTGTQEKQASQQAPKQEPFRLDLEQTMNAVFTTNGLPLQVTIRRLNETSALYTATLDHKKLPKDNRLTIDKTSGHMRFVYKLKGPFAPELVCEGFPVAPNTYSGPILTHDGNAVNVGVFTLILAGK